MDRKHFSKIGLSFCFATLMMLLVQNIALLIIDALGDRFPVFAESADVRLLCLMLPVYLIVYPLTFLLLKKVPATPMESKKKMKAGHLIVAAIMCYSIVYVFNIVGGILTFIIGLFKQSEVTNSFVEVSGSISIPTNLLLVVICSPILEELFFRKVLIDRTRKYGEGVSVVLSGLLFSLFHGNLNQAVYTFFMGCFLAFIYVKTNNITYSILLHMISNFIGSILANLVLKVSGFDQLALQLTNELSEAEMMNLLMENSTGIILFLGYAFGLICLVIAGIVLWIVTRKRFTLTPGEVVIEKGQRFKTVLCNVGMGLYCIFWMVEIIVQLLQ